MLALALVAAVTLGGTPEPAVDSKGSLGGIEAFVVRIVGIDEEARKVGISEAAIRDQVEGALRRKGIRIATAMDDGGEVLAGRAFLRVSVMVATATDRASIGSSLRVSQVVRLSSGELAYGQTWTDDAVAGTTISWAAPKLREALQRSLDRFRDQYLEARALRASRQALGSRAAK